MNYFSENKKMVKFCFSLMIYILTIVSTIIGQNTWNERVKYINNVPRIENPENPIFSKIEITLEKVWEIGGENPEFIFQNTTSLDVDENGYIFVADVLGDDIKVFSPTGEYLFKFGRKGQGPGEFQSPRCLTILPNKKILVIDIGGGSIIPYFKFFNIDGKYIDGYRVNLRKNESGSNQIKRNKKDILSMPRIFYSQLFNDDKLVKSTNSI